MGVGRLRETFFDNLKYYEGLRYYSHGHISALRTDFFDGYTLDTVAAVIHSYSITPELQYNSVYQKNFFFYSALQQQSQLLTVQFVRGTSEGCVS